MQRNKDFHTMKYFYGHEFLRITESEMSFWKRRQSTQHNHLGIAILVFVRIESRKQNSISAEMTNGDIAHASSYLCLFNIIFVSL